MADFPPAGRPLGGIGFLLGPPIPITQMDLVSNLFLQRGIGPATFTRPTIGRFDDVSTGLNTTAAIDEARFETNGVLIEGSIPNLLLRSEEFDNVIWSKTRSSITANATTSPDGTVNAFKLVDTTDNNNHNMSQFTNSAASLGNYTASVYLKAGEITLCQLRGISDAAGTPVTSNLVVDLVNGIITDTDSGVLDSNITSLINGWYRVDITFAHAVSARVDFQIFLTKSSTVVSNPTYIGNGTDGLFIWGAQLEELLFASSYIKTLASPVTRGKDNLSIVTANIPAPTNNYTISMEVDILGLDPTKTQMVFSVDGETSREIVINTTTGLVEATHGAVTSTSATALTPGTKVKIAFAVGDTNQTLYINGVQEDQDVKGTVTGTATAISIANAAGLNQLFGHSKFNKIFAKELTPDEVARL